MSATLVNYLFTFKNVHDENELPKSFKKCHHVWRELSKEELRTGTFNTHECVLCGLEKDDSVNPVSYSYPII